MRKSRFTLICLSMLAVCLSPTLLAQDDDDEPKTLFSTGKKPFVYVSVPSLNHLKNKLDYVLNAAEQPDALTSILKTLEENANGLDGIDWNRSAGAMIFLNSIVPPSIEVVGVLPISDQDRFQAMMELGNSVMRKKRDASNENHYELITPFRNYQLRQQDGFAYIQADIMNPDPAFDRELPAATALFASLNSQFDIGVTLDVDAIPKTTRDLMVNFLTSTMSTQMQQRDSEPDSSYELRRSWAQADIDGLKLFFKECRNMSLGLRVNPDNQSADVDFLMDVNDVGELLQEILASNSKPSYFGPILSEEAPVSLSWSAVLGQRDIDRYINTLAALKPEASRLIEEHNFGDVPTSGSPLFLAIDSLSQTAEEGHVDLFGQMYNDSSGKLALIGAMRVKDGEALGLGLGDLLQRIQVMDDFPEDDVELLVGATEHNGVSFHQLKLKKPDAGAKEIFGSAPGLSVGCSGRTLWVCFGGKDSFDTLTSVIDQLTSSYENPIERALSSPMRLIVQVNELVQLGMAANAANKQAVAEQVAADAAETKTEQQPKDQNRRAAFEDDRTRRFNRRRERREAGRNMMIEELAAGDDQIRLDVRPTDSGVRMRINLQEAFIRAFGRMLGSRFESNE